jgi:uncharacterized protein YdbL (DUF1318 family)
MSDAHEVDRVLDAWHEGRLKGYNFTIGEGTLAERVAKCIADILHHRQAERAEAHQRADETEDELEGMKQREGAVERVLDSLVDGRLKLAEYIDPETPAGRVKETLNTLLHQVRDAEERAALAERKLDAHHRHDAATEHADGPFLPASDARAEAHLIKVALDHFDRGDDPRVTLHFQGRPLATRVVDTIAAARCDHDAHTDADAVRAGVAARIRAAAAAELSNAQSNPAGGVGDEFNAYLAGMDAAARIADGEPAEADPSVAHIDTVNGRAAEADARLVEPGSMVEAILATGGTVAIDDTGEPHIIDTPLVQIGPGTLITADGTRHEFTSGTAKHLNHDTEGDTDD